MPAGSGHGVSEEHLAALRRFPLKGKLQEPFAAKMTAALFCAALRKDRLLARECSFSAWVIHEGARRSRISRPAGRDQGSALDLRFFEKNRVKL